MRTLLSAVLCLGTCCAGAVVDPSGHWEGTISAPMGDIRIEVDLAKDGKGKPVGTFGQPDQKLKGFPLSNVIVEGGTVGFEIVSTGGGRFDGILSDDGKSLSGAFNAQAGTVPFSLTRKGDAVIEAAPRNAAVSKDVEGAWNGTLDVQGRQLRLVLKLANQPDGSSLGSMISVDEGGVELPLTIAQKGASLSLDVRVIGSNWSGDLNAAHNELVGMYRLSEGMTLPLTFRRGQ
jgi:hypothetical protein